VLDAPNERLQDIHHLAEQQQLPLVAPNDAAETLRT
jgi:hypothetical protein